MMTLFASNPGGGAEFVLFVIAVIGFVVVATIINRVQRWWEQVKREASQRIPPLAGAPRRPEIRPGGPPVIRPQPPLKRGDGLPRPVIRENLPPGQPRRRPPQVRGPRQPVATPPEARPRPPIRPIEVPSGNEPLSPLRPSPVATSSSVSAPVVGSIAQSVLGMTKDRLASSAASSAGTDSRRPTRDELRRAIILNELLSAPIALRDA